MFVSAITMVMANCVIKLLRPKTTIFPQDFAFRRNEAESRRIVLKRGIYTTDTIKEATCPATVAIAAPLTPISKIKINTGSRITLRTAPITMESIAYLGLPSARIMELTAAEIIMKGIPIPIMYP